MVKFSVCLLGGLCLLGAVSGAFAAPPAGAPAHDVARDRAVDRGRSAADVRAALERQRGADARAHAARSGIESRRGLLDEHDRLAPRSDRAFGRFHRERHPAANGLERAAVAGRASASDRAEGRKTRAGFSAADASGRQATAPLRNVPDATPLDRADRLLATRLAQIDRMRDRALDEGNEHLLQVADQLEQIARRQYGDRVGRLDSERPPESPVETDAVPRLSRRQFRRSTATGPRPFDPPVEESATSAPTGDSADRAAQQ